MAIDPPPTETVPVRYVAELDTLVDDSAVAPTHTWYLVEPETGGWFGYAVVDPGPGARLTPGELFGRMLDHDFRPGVPVALGLWLADGSGRGSTPSWLSPGTDPDDPVADTDGAQAAGSDEGLQLTPIRTWPSVVTEVTANLDDSGEHCTCLLRLRDPVTALRNVAVWGAFREYSVSELLGGALSLAVGGDGRPTTTPWLPNMPTVAIHEDVRASIATVPYAVASGEPLGMWLATVFGRLGVRMEMLGTPGGMVTITLRDAEPGGTPVGMTVGPGPASARNMVVKRIRHSPDVRDRDTIVDNPSAGAVLRLLQAAPDPASTPENPTFAELPVGAVLSAAHLGTDEAAVRAGFDGERAGLQRTTLDVVTAQPGLHPGRLVELRDRPVSGADAWQALRAQHGSTAGNYRNTVRLMKAGVPWRPLLPPDLPMVTVSAVIDDGESAPGEEVARDGLGRIPVSFVFLPAPDGQSWTPEPTRLSLTVVDPMAGGTHGFVPSHRQGDMCRVAIHHPLYAEIMGFNYRDDRSINEGLKDVSMGVIARHEGDAWSGIAFRPGEAVEAEEAEAGDQAPPPPDDTSDGSS